MGDVNSYQVKKFKKEGYINEMYYTEGIRDRERDSFGWGGQGQSGQRPQRGAGGAEAWWMRSNLPGDVRMSWLCD